MLRDDLGEAGHGMDQDAEHERGRHAVRW